MAGEFGAKSASLAIHLEARLSAPSMLTATASPVAEPRAAGAFYALLNGRLTIQIEGSAHEIGHRRAAFIIGAAEHVAVLADNPGKQGGPTPRAIAAGLRLVHAGREDTPPLLPSVLHTSDADGPAVALIGALETALLDGPEDDGVLVSQIATALLGRALSGREASGGLRAGLDIHLGPVLRLIHDHPGADWSVGRLADEAGLSRTVFIERFTAAVGSTPARYLRDARMARAELLLRVHGASVAEAARAVGYRSESAFSAAFRRWAGVAPGVRRKR
ncbi:MAG: AraC family transcriptional regulator [Planctomycetota bacterium]